MTTAEHPAHYTASKYEPLDVIEEWSKHWDPRVAHHCGCALKYIARHPLKQDPVGDLKKSIVYLQRAARILEAHHVAPVVEAEPVEEDDPTVVREGDVRSYYGRHYTVHRGANDTFGVVWDSGAKGGFFAYQSIAADSLIRRGGS